MLASVTGRDGWSPEFPASSQSMCSPLTFSRREAPPDERGGNRYVRPTATAPHSDSTQLSRSRRILRTASMGHLERFPPERVSGRCQIGQGTSARPPVGFCTDPKQPLVDTCAFDASWPLSKPSQQAYETDDRRRGGADVDEAIDDPDQRPGGSVVMLVFQGYLLGVRYGRRYTPTTLRSRKSWMSGKTSSALSSSTKWPVSKRWNSRSRRSRL